MTSRVDMHCHSTASQLSRLGVQRCLGLPECATPPEEVYELAKRRGMDFVTITDHDTIDGCLELADRPDCFVSEELTARFAGEPQAVHVLCYGITPGDHEWLQAHAGDVEACAAYLHENEIACALAHPFYNVDAPLTRRHRRRLAELFPVWEVRNGSRAAELNMPAVDLHRDPRGHRHRRLRRSRRRGHRPHLHRGAGRLHAGRVSAPRLRARRGRARRRAGQRRQVGARRDGARDARPRPRRTDRGRGRARPRRGAEDGAAGDRRGRRPRGQGRRRHRPRRRPRPARVLAALGRHRAARPRADRLPAVRRLLPRRPLPARPPHPRAAAARRGRAGRSGGAAAATLGAAVGGLFDALLPAVPYAPATAFLGAEKAKLGGRRRAAAGRPDRRRDRGDARRHPHDRADPRAAACPASRSRSSAPTPASTGGCRPRPRSRSPSTRG